MRPTVKLGEICKFQNGFAFKSELFKGKGEPILRISNIQKDNISDDKLVFFDLEDYDNLDTYIVNPGELVIAMSGATTGKIAINNTNKKYYLNQRVGKFSFDNDITKEYCHYFLGTKVEENLNKAAGAAIQNLSSKQILDIQIPLPPLETQKDIVAKLDQIFVELDQTKSKIQKNLDNTDELWKSALNQAFQGGWEMKKLGEVAEIGPKKAEISLDENTKVSFVPMSDLSQEEMLFQTKNENTISELRKGSYTYFKNNDVLLAKVTPCFENGKCGIAKNLTSGIGFGSSEFIVFRPKDFIKSEFLYYFVSKKAFREEGAKNMGGAVGLQRVKKDWIENHNIPVPPLSEQEKIVEHLDQVSKEVKELKSQYQSQLDNLDELKKSVLDKAFRGELGE